MSTHLLLMNHLQGLEAEIQSLSTEIHESASRAELARRVRMLSQEVETLTRIARSLGAAPREGRPDSFAGRVACHFLVEKSLSGFCARTLDELILETKAKGAAFLVFPSEGGGVEAVAVRTAGRGDAPLDALRVNRALLAALHRERVSARRADVSLGDSDGMQKDPSTLLVPVDIDGVLGALHLERDATEGAFDDEDRSLVAEGGRLIAVYCGGMVRSAFTRVEGERSVKELVAESRFKGIVGSCDPLLNVLETVALAGPSDATVLIEGESGSGKELIAEAIHRSSRRATKPMVVLNCAAIPEPLLESELFGHEKGAFTGAFERKLGRVEQAHEGTLFLDEVAELPPPVQAKLLRFLQQREITRLGGAQTIKLNVRLVAATSRDMRALVREGKFREDLFYRLEVVPIKVPPLRSRSECIPSLVDHYCRIYGKPLGRESIHAAPDVYEVLRAYPWPGNVRELENVVHRMVVLSKGDRLERRDIPAYILERHKMTLDLDANPFGALVSRLPADYPDLKRRRKEMLQVTATYMKALEYRFILATLEANGGNVCASARAAGIHRTVIHRRLKEMERKGVIRSAKYRRPRKMRGSGAEVECSGPREAGDAETRSATGVGPRRLEDDAPRDEPDDESIRSNGALLA